MLSAKTVTHSESMSVSASVCSFGYGVGRDVGIKLERSDMGLEVIHGDVLNSSAEALLLTIDGTKQGMEGNIARQFAKLFPEDWTYLLRDIKYPVPIGRTVAVLWDGDCQWKYLLFASTLHHVDTLDDGQKLGVIRSALAEALQLCVRLQIRSLATAVMQGGWRLSAEDALLEMGKVYRSVGCGQVKLQIYQVQQP